MAIRTLKSNTNAQRNMSYLESKEITKKTPEKSLGAPKKKTSGRNNQGKITTRHHGGGGKQKYRIVDFKRNKDALLLLLKQLNTIQTDQLILL